ncbi:AMP-binding enzyme [Rhodococcus opacus]|uniref:AMP-binding enzyme n=1 Tax=Rhodococcus opacus TaxID=37919 RepID=UPI0035C73C5E
MKLLDACREAHQPSPPTVLSEELVALVRRRIGPVAVFRDVVIVDRLPKTRPSLIPSSLADRQQPTEPHRALT